MKRQLLMPLGVVWLAAVGAAWLGTMPLLALLIKVTGTHRTVGGLVGLAAISATFACVVVGGSVSAVALCLRRTHAPHHAVLSGFATGAVVLLFCYSYLAATGTSVAGAWKALLPLVVIIPAELMLALALRRYCYEDEPPETPPSKTPPDQPEGSALPPHPDMAARQRYGRPVSRRDARSRLLAADAGHPRGRSATGLAAWC